MKVRELVALLQAQDPELDVIVTTTCHGCYGDELSVSLDLTPPATVIIEGDK